MTASIGTAVRVDEVGDVALITIDDGKANALGHQMLDDLQAALAAAEVDAKAVVLAGRPGKFSAGFDLAVMSEGPDSARALLGHGAEFFFQCYMLGIPVVAACTGHALAAGAVILMATDVRIGEDVPAKIGLNEVAIGMALPRFIIEMARDRLSKRHLPGLNLAKIYDPSGAVDAGYLDEVVAEGTSVDRALAVATQLAETLHAPSFKATRTRLRSDAHGRFRSTLDADLAAFTVA
jgi:enoyl-CoA hydratase